MRLFPQHLYLDKDDDGAAPADAGESTDTTSASEDGAEPSTMEDAVLAALNIDGESTSDTGADETADDAATSTGADDAPSNPAEAAAKAAIDGSEPGKETATDDPTKDDKTDPDADLAEAPKGLDKRGTERWNTLHTRLREHRERADTAEARIAQVAEQHNGLVEQITSTGANEQEFGMALQYMRAIHSDNPADLEQARAMVQAELAGIEQRLGIVPADEQRQEALLAEHPDLVKMVENLEMSREAALTVVASRKQRDALDNRRQQQDQRREQETQTQQQIEQRNAAMGEVNQIEAYLKQNDPSWERKAPIMLQRVQQIAMDHPPEQWRERVVAAYKEISATMQAAAPPAPRNKNEQPLRSGGGGGTTHKEPATMADAVLQDLGISS